MSKYVTSNLSCSTPRLFFELLPLRILFKSLGELVNIA